jgi:cellulose binding protein with CBM2 domain
MKRSGLWHVDFRPDRRDWAVWLPTLLGVGVLLMMLALAAHRLVSPPPDGTTVVPAPITPYPPQPAATTPPMIPAPATTSTSPDPQATSEPPSRPSSSRPSSSGPPSSGPSSRPSSRPSRTSRPAPPPPPVTGRYRVVDSFGDGFIGEVLVGNTTGAPADWVVALRFPGNVGALRASWVESAPQATLTREGDSFVWRSGVPVPGKSSVALRFHFARQGTGDRPSSCTVNAATCA